MTEHRGITTYSSAEETLAAYERALADYEAVRERLTVGEQTPGLHETAQSLYDETVATHRRLLTFYETSEQEKAVDVDAGGAAVGSPESATDAGPDWDLTELEPAPASHAPVAAPTAAAGAVLGRRPGVQRFVPPVPEGSVPLRKDLLSASRTAGRNEIGRERKIAGGLPEWDPLPPGEIIEVARRG